LLKTFATDSEGTQRKSPLDAALAAIVLHKDPAAVATLIDLARNSTGARVRKQAMFWLGQSKDPSALRFFEQVLK
jgi:HEAT repeat protein